MAYHHIADHHSMVFDEKRNQAYENALRAVVNSDSVVLDLGAGLGVLGMLAATMGAKKVYLVDPSPVLTAAQKVSSANTLDNVECLFGGIDDIELPEKVDIIISVFTGNFLLSEDLLPLLFKARDTYLKPGGCLIPSEARMWCSPVAITPYCERRVFKWLDTAQNLYQSLDLSAVNEYAVNSVYCERFNESTIESFAEPQQLSHFDFYQAERAECFSQSHFTISNSGIMHGWIGWFDMKLGDSWLCTGPFSPLLHWSQLLLPLEKPTPLTKGELIELDLKRPQFGEWSWLSKGEGFRYIQSTFLGTPRRACDIPIESTKP